MTTYLLIVNRSEDSNGRWVSAMTMAKRRLTAGQWGLYNNTPHRKEMKPGDSVIVYLAGLDKDAKRFVATAVISKIDTVFNHYKADGPDSLSDPPVAILALQDVNWLSKPVAIAEIKDRLGFIPKGSNKWGCVLQRGAKRITDADANIILDWHI